MANGDINYCSYQNVSAVRLVFLGKQCAGNPGDAFPAIYTSASQPVFPGGSTSSFRDTAVAYYNAPTAGDPNNKSTLDALAKRFAADYLSWFQFTGDATLAGVCNVAPLPLYDFVAIDYMTGDGVCKTRITTAPALDQHPRELGHYDYASDCQLTSFPCFFYYGPPGQCSGSHVQLTRYRLCLQDGRLLSTFVSTDNIT